MSTDDRNNNNNHGRPRPPPMTTARPSPIATTSTTETHPKASYEEVVADGRLFMETLGDLHKSQGTKFLVPTIGGKPLDLHRLFVEVTCRGGLQKVIGDRKWSDIISAFAFPSTTISASFVLRKNYVSLLQTYEKVYFFRKGDSKVPSNGSEDAKVSSASEACDATISTMLGSIVEHRTLEHPPLRVGSLVKGKINGKFENGYLVTANFGSETLNGVLYLVSHQPLKTPDLPLSRKRGRKRSRKEADPSSLKSDMGGYNIFCAEQYSKLRPLYSGKEKVIVKHINSLWNNLVESEKEVYQERDRERCKPATS